MKTMSALLCTLMLLCALPALATDTAADAEAAEPTADAIDNVEATEARETVEATEDDEAIETVAVEFSACGDEAFRFPLTPVFDKDNATSWSGCAECCDDCDPVGTRIPCDLWCGCSC